MYVYTETSVTPMASVSHLPHNERSSHYVVGRFLFLVEIHNWYHLSGIGTNSYRVVASVTCFLQLFCHGNVAENGRSIPSDHKPCTLSDSPSKYCL